MRAVRLSIALFLTGIAACQTLIDLGEEPVLGCGIARAPGPECATCLDSNCCEASLACSRDPVCKEAAETCLVNCFVPECVGECLRLHDGNAALDAYFNCAAGCPEECTPDDACWDLSLCCPSVTEPTLHEGCIRNARSENQQKCRDSLKFLGCEGQGGAGGE